MIKAIVFDCFGVLRTDGWLPFKQKYFGQDLKKFEEASRLNALSDSGKIPYSQFISMIADLAEMPSNDAQREIESNMTNNAIFEYITSELKPHYAIGMLSNVSVNWLDSFFNPEQVKLFNAVALSYETGFVKPQRQAYESIAKKLGLDLGECLLVDDQEQYVEGAKQVGMHAVVYKSLESLKKDLPIILKMADSDK